MGSFQNQFKGTGNVKLSFKEQRGKILFNYELNLDANDYAPLLIASVLFYFVFFSFIVQLPISQALIGIAGLTLFFYFFITIPLKIKQGNLETFTIKTLKEIASVKISNEPENKDVRRAT